MTVVTAPVVRLVACAISPAVIARRRHAAAWNTSVQTEPLVHRLDERRAGHQFPKNSRSSSAIARARSRPVLPSRPPVSIFYINQMIEILAYKEHRYNILFKARRVVRSASHPNREGEMS
jgi:hypothetical protein